MSISGWRSSVDSSCQAAWVSPVENCIGSKLGLDSIASTSPVAASSSTQATLCSRSTAAGDEFLHRHVEPEDDVLARLPRPAAKLAHDAAIGVDLDLAGAGEAAQLRVLRLLDPALADAEIGQFEQRVAGQILFGNRRDIAQHMRGDRAVGVIPDETLFDRHAGQFRNRDLDARHLLPAQIGAHDDRNKGVLAARLAQDAALFGLAELDHAAERPQRRLDIAGLLRHDDDAVIAPVVGEGDAEAVEDAPAHRRQQPQIDAVLLGEDRIAVALQDLQLVQAGDQRGAEHPLPRREQGGPPGQQRVAL